MSEITHFQEKPTENNNCFVIMPIADTEGYEKGHFKKVYEDIFRVACENSGFNAIRADEVQQTNLIHLDILQKLIESPMAICDLSSRNPNVLFELGLRQAFDKPTVLVQECGTPKIFDISPLRYTEYRKELKYREVLEDQQSIADAIKATKLANQQGEGVNSIVSLLSLSNPASLKEVSINDTTKILQVIMSEMSDLRTDFREASRVISEKNYSLKPSESYIELEIEKSQKDLLKMRDLISQDGDIETIGRVYNRIQRRSRNLLNTQFVLPKYQKELETIDLEAERLYIDYFSKKF